MWKLYSVKNSEYNKLTSKGKSYRTIYDMAERYYMAEACGRHYTNSIIKFDKQYQQAIKYNSKVIKNSTFGLVSNEEAMMMAKSGFTITGVFNADGGALFCSMSVNKGGIKTAAAEGAAEIEAAEGGSKGNNIGDIIKDIKTKTPEQLMKEGWQDVTDPRKLQNTTSRDLYDPKTGVKISFDKGKEGATGFEAVDHYHITNPDYTNKKVDYYFDIKGNPVGKGSKASHIEIEK